jgi:hypothetical protein
MKKPQPEKRSAASKPAAQPERLKGWDQIAQFLGQPIAAAQRWARSGMPVKREGLYLFDRQSPIMFSPMPEHIVESQLIRLLENAADVSGSTAGG